ncbi:MAG: DUF1800 domain-containing protein, partial [Aquihabitans sp.]
TRSAVAHLLRRAGFGGHPDEVDALAEFGYEGAVDRVCQLDKPDPAADAIPPPTLESAAFADARDGDREAKRLASQRLRRDSRAIIMWWLKRMVAAEQPLREKLTFLWHDHFATSLIKVKRPALMLQQRQVLYDLGPGRFDVLLGALLRDPAMLIWLDGVKSTAEAPNENLGRELLELFTLGHTGGGAHQHISAPYAEADVQGLARALTGWVIDRQTGTSRHVPRRHDAGTKTVLGTTGPLGIDEVVAVVTQHPACAPHVVARLWSRLARPAGPDDPVVQELAKAFARDLDVTALVRAMFLHPEFLAPTTRSALVKMPVELVVGMARALRFDPEELTPDVLDRLGQVPFMPPDVSGWPAGPAWLSTSSALLRLQIADRLATLVGSTPIASAPPAARPAEAARLLGIDRWTDATADALAAAASEPQRLLTIALASPEALLA